MEHDLFEKKVLPALKQGKIMKAVKILMDGGLFMVHEIEDALLTCGPYTRNDFITLYFSVLNIYNASVTERIPPGTTEAKEDEILQRNARRFMDAYKVEIRRLRDINKIHVQILLVSFVSDIYIFNSFEPQFMIIDEQGMVIINPDNLIARARHELHAEGYLDTQ